MDPPVPLLLPSNTIPRLPSSGYEWTPKKYSLGPQPPPVDDMRMLEQEMAAARQLADGKTVKKTRPRRTVDYNGGMGRWTLVSQRNCFFLFLLIVHSFGSIGLVRPTYPV